jgi:hypothetical protein
MPKNTATVFDHEFADAHWESVEEGEEGNASLAIFPIHADEDVRSYLKNCRELSAAS